MRVIPRTDAADTSELMRLIVPKGYITVDGTSLTVVDTGADWFNLMLVQYTQSKILLPKKRVGDKVNLEADIVGKYVESLVVKKQAPPPRARL